MNSIIAFSLASLNFLCAPGAALASPPATRSNVDDGIALHGYDPISYLDGKPVEGKRELTHAFEGANYRFANAANLAKFQTDPARYEPAYKGWCAYAMAGGEKVDVDPKTYKVIDGKAFLFYNGLFGNTLKKWNVDEPALHKKADAKWSTLP